MAYKVVKEVIAPVHGPGGEVLASPGEQFGADHDLGPGALWRLAIAGTPDEPPDEPPVKPAEADAPEPVAPEPAAAKAGARQPAGKPAGRGA